MHLLSSQLLASIYPMIGGVIGLVTVLACIAFLLRRQLAHWEGKRPPHTTRPATQYLDKHLYRGSSEFKDRIFGRPADSEREMKPDHAESGGEQLAAPQVQSLMSVHGKVFRLLPQLLKQDSRGARPGERR